MWPESSLSRTKLLDSLLLTLASQSYTHSVCVGGPPVHCQPCAHACARSFVCVCVLCTRTLRNQAVCVSKKERPGRQEKKIEVRSLRTRALTLATNSLRTPEESIHLSGPHFLIYKIVWKKKKKELFTLYESLAQMLFLHYCN